MKAKLQQCRGLRRFIELIQNHKIPVVAHNSLLDFTYLYRNCIGELPENLETFQENFQKELFPSMVDLKHLLTHHPKLCDVTN